jgi:hypothetical protein
MDLNRNSQTSSSIRSLAGQMFTNPKALGLHPTLQMVGAPKGLTFYYRAENKRIIEFGWTDEYRLNRVYGPLVYAVTDGGGVVRYIGRHLAETPLRSRWFRHGHIHHHSERRNNYIAELDAGRGPLLVWSAAARELRSRLPGAVQTMVERDLASNLEALWVRRWRNQLWNQQRGQVAVGFDDGAYWAHA